VRIRILIVDDHNLVAEGLEALVSAQAEFEVVGRAANGLDAVREALALKPDVVLMDMSMPNINGIEATRAIRKSLPGTHVIVLSVHPDADYVQRAMEAGAQGYLLKRTAARNLVKAIRAAHVGLRFFSEQIAENVVERYREPAPARNALAALSARERQVLQMLAESRTMAEIALALHLSRKTIETYRARLFDKLGVHDLPALVRFAVRSGLISLE
jgi:DNA-binding NarL/FixJ family response regulator